MIVARSFQWSIESWACIFVALIYDQSQARTRSAENTRTHSALSLKHYTIPGSGCKCSRTIGVYKSLCALSSPPSLSQGRQ